MPSILAPVASATSVSRGHADIGRLPCGHGLRARTAFVANYASGTVAAFPTRPDGSLAEASSVDQHEGSGLDATRQQGPHAHCIVLAPDERWLAFSADLGTDEVIGYRVDHEAHAPTRDSRLAMTPGSGPRQLVFSPSGRHAWMTGGSTPR